MAVGRTGLRRMVAAASDAAGGRVLGSHDPGWVELQARGGHGVPEAVLAALGRVDAGRAAGPADPPMAVSDEVLGGQPRRALIIEDHPARRADRAPVHQQRGQVRVAEELVGVMARAQTGQERGIDRAAAQQAQVALGQSALVGGGPQQQATLRCDLLGAGDDGHHERVAGRDQQADRTGLRSSQPASVEVGPIAQRGGSLEDALAGLFAHTQRGVITEDLGDDGAIDAGMLGHVGDGGATRPPQCGAPTPVVHRHRMRAPSPSGQPVDAARLEGLPSPPGAAPHVAPARPGAARCGTCGSASWASSGATGPT